MSYRLLSYHFGNVSHGQVLNTRELRRGQCLAIKWSTKMDFVNFSTMKGEKVCIGYTNRARELADSVLIGR